MSSPPARAAMPAPPFPLAPIPAAPAMPGASPVGDIACPLGLNATPSLTTPMWGVAMEREDRESSVTGGSPGGGLQDGIRGLSGMENWAWEMGSEAGSVPSAWSKPSTVHSSVSRISNATGSGLIPGLVDGQRLSQVKPDSVPTAGGKVIVSLRKEVPHGHWDNVEIVLVRGPVQKRLKPTGIKKGKKLCIQVPEGMEPGDYDVRLSFCEKIVHGAIPLTIHDGEVEEHSDDEAD